MKLIIFGATGGTGRALVEQGLAAGHDVAAFVRNADRLGKLAPQILTGDLADPAAVEAAVRGRDAVLSALGTRPWRHTDICSQGTRAILAGMRATGVRRIIVVSSMGVGDSSLGLLGGLFAKLVIRRALRDKGVMEDELAASDRDWTAIRPGLLTNGKRRNTWRAADDGSLRGGRISRADVAAFALAQLTSDEWLRKTPSLVR